MKSYMLSALVLSLIAVSYGKPLDANGADIHIGNCFVDLCVCETVYICLIARDTLCMKSIFFCNKFVTKRLNCPFDNYDDVVVILCNFFLYKSDNLRANLT